MNIASIFNKKKTDDDGATSPRNKPKSPKIEDGEHTVRFWHIPGSSSSRILWLIRELDQEFFDSLQITTLKSAKELTHWFPKENTPVHNVPVIRFGGNSDPIWESGAIIQHLLDKYKVSTLTPESWDDMNWHKHHLFTFWALTTLDYKILNKNLSKQWKSFEKVITDGLGDNEYVNGKDFTVTDIIIGFSLHLAHTKGLLKHSPKQIVDYYQRLSQRKAFVSSLSSDPHKETITEVVAVAEPVEEAKADAHESSEKSEESNEEEKAQVQEEQEPKETTLASIGIYIVGDNTNYFHLAAVLHAIERSTIEAGNKLNNYDFAKLALTAVVGPLIREEE